MVKKITGAFNDLQTDVDKTQTKMQQFQSALGKLEMPNFNAMLQVAERLGAQFASATETGMSFGQSMADLSSITGIVGEELEGLEANSRRFGKESGLGADAAARAYSLLASQIEISKIGIDGLNKLEEKSITLAHASGTAFMERQTLLREQSTSSVSGLKQRTALSMFLLLDQNTVLRRLKTSRSHSRWWVLPLPLWAWMWNPLQELWKSSHKQTSREVRRVPLYAI